MNKLSFEPTRFRLEQLADGLFAAIGEPGKGAGANAGIIDLGDRTLLFDSFQTLGAAEELKRAAEELTGRPVSILVNSHSHPDHTFGNQLFEGASIIAAPKTREEMVDRTAHQLKVYIEMGPGYLAQQEERLAALTDPAERERFAVEVSGLRQLVQSAPAVRLVLPHLLMEERLRLAGSKRTVELFVHQGHTFSDIVCWLPEEKICFTADLVAVANHPWLGHGTPEGWLQTCDRLEELGIQRLVPGHGEPAGPEWIDEIRRYLKAVMAYADELAAAGTPAEEAAKLPPLAPHAPWDSRQVFGWNMNFLVERLAKREG